MRENPEIEEAGLDNVTTGRTVAHKSHASLIVSLDIILRGPIGFVPTAAYTDQTPKSTAPCIRTRSGPGRP